MLRLVKPNVLVPQTNWPDTRESLLLRTAPVLASRRKNRSYGRRRLNKAFYLLALNQIRGRNKHPGSVEARRYYNKKLAEGKAPKHALRCLMR